MKKPLLTIATFAAAITLLNADTITWTGGAGTADHATPGNWDLNRTPVETGAVWREVARLADNPGGRQEHVFAPVEAHMLRIAAKKRNTAYGISIFEAEISK